MFHPRSAWIHSVWMLLATLLVFTGCGSDDNSPLNPNPPDEAPPLAPSGVGVLEQNSLKFTIAWSPNAEPDLAGYRVYLSEREDSGATYRCLTGTSLVQQNRFVFGGQAGVSYSLCVTAVDTSGNESAWSESFDLACVASAEDSPFDNGREVPDAGMPEATGGGTRPDQECDHLKGRTR